MSFDYKLSFIQGGHWAERVAQRLRDSGVECYAPEIQIAQTAEERDYMTKHEKDIVFNWTDSTIEVKSSTRNFTDFVEAYPYDSLFVDTVSGYEGKAMKPMAYAIISQQEEGVVCIPPSSYTTWTKVRAYDKHREIWETFYSAPKEALIPFSALVDYLKEHENTELMSRVLDTVQPMPVNIEEL